MGDRVTARRQRFWRLLQRIVPKTIAKKYNYSCGKVSLEGPFLLVSNHVTNDDPFLVGLACKRGPVSFVASEHIFRLGAASRLIEALLAPIPRSKGASGAGAVKSILRRLREGVPVALFAEGDCTWDGRSSNVFPATGKLAKASGTPLVTFRLTGGYLICPRWAKKLRGGSMRGQCVHVYTPEELASMTAEQVTAAIDRDIFEDAWARQKQERKPIPSQKRAEGLERALVVCPKCGRLGSLGTRGNSLFCRECGMEAGVDEYGFFENAPGFETVADWDEWQRGELKKLSEAGSDSQPPLIRGRFTRLMEQGRNRGGSVKAQLRLLPGLDGIEIGGESFGFDVIDDMSMVKTVRLLFSSNGGYYEFKSKEGALRLVLLAYGAYRAKKSQEGS